MSSVAGVARRVFVRDESVPQAELVGDRALLERVLAALRESVALDLVFDDLEAVLGEQAPTEDEVVGLTPRLRCALQQLVHILLERVNERPGRVESAAVERARCALAESAPTTPAAARGHVRRLALAAQDVLDIVVGDST